MILLIIILSYLDPFRAEVKDFKGNRLVKQDTVLVYYKKTSTEFYVSIGWLCFDGSVNGTDKTFNVNVGDIEHWHVFIVSEKHLILSTRNRTIVIRGL